MLGYPFSTHSALGTVGTHLKSTNISAQLARLYLKFKYDENDNFLNLKKRLCKTYFFGGGRRRGCGHLPDMSWNEKLDK